MKQIFSNLCALGAIAFLAQACADKSQTPAVENFSAENYRAKPSAKPEPTPAASEETTAAATAELPQQKNDGLRLPDDMLALPDASKLKSSPSEKKKDVTLITRPPLEE